MKLTDKRFWIFELLIAIPSCLLGIWIWGGDVELIAPFLFAGSMSGLIGFKTGHTSVLKMSLTTWLSYNIILTGGLFCLSIGKSAAIQGYILLFGFILLIASFLPFIIISWVYFRIFMKK
ncbi:MAG: hypothetical protein K2M17_02875 [Bacilli bacterium]|nr:hypothetical protein [Bacilli bacterium]